MLAALLNDQFVIVISGGSSQAQAVPSTLADGLTWALGTIRKAESPDRQYFPIDRGLGTNLYQGALRAWGSTDQALFVTYPAIPLTDLHESDAPDMIPAQVQKYLRYYVLAMAFGRVGEGQNPLLAQHYMDRFNKGVKLMKKMADVAREGRLLAREMIGPDVQRRVPYVHLPTTFERIW